MILSLCFASCTESGDSGDGGDTSEKVTTEGVPYASAAELFEAIDAKMESYDSYESGLSVNFKAFVNGIEFSTTAEGIDIRTGVNSDNPEFYTQIKTTVSSPVLSSTQKVTMVEAYYGGNYFISNRGDGCNQKLYSPMSKEDAAEYNDDDGDDFFEFDECENREFVKNDDGTWTLTFSGYTEETIGEMIDDFGIDRSMLNADVSDVVVLITADEDLNATELKLDFAFEQTPGETSLPEISVACTFSKFGEAVIDPSPIDPEKYTKVDDIRLLDEIDDMWSSRLEVSEGEFTLTLSQSVTVMGESQYAQEVDKVVYGTGSDGYFYDIDAETGGVKYDISYKNGVQSVVVDGQSTTQEQTEADARAFVEGLIDSCDFSKITITGIEKVSENEYSFTCEPDEAYEAVFESMGATFRSVKRTITFTVEDGKIVKVFCNDDAKGAFTQGNNTFEVSLNVKSSVDFIK